MYDFSNEFSKIAKMNDEQFADYFITPEALGAMTETEVDCINYDAMEIKKRFINLAEKTTRLEDGRLQRRQWSRVRNIENLLNRIESSK